MFPRCILLEDLRRDDMILVPRIFKVIHGVVQAGWVFASIRNQSDWAASLDYIDLGSDGDSAFFRPFWLTWVQHFVGQSLSTAL